MKQRLDIKHVLPSLNEYIDEIGRHNREGGKFKKKWMQFVQTQIRSCKLRPVTQAVFKFIWIEKNKKRDKDNITGFGKKVILDALVQEEIIENDGWRHVIGFEDHYYTVRTSDGVLPDGGVVVFIEEIQVPEAERDSYGQSSVSEMVSDWDASQGGL